MEKFLGRSTRSLFLILVLCVVAFLSTHRDLASNLGVLEAAVTTTKEEALRSLPPPDAADALDDPPAEWKSRVRFFLLGVEKAGTSSLYRYMVQHPQVASPKTKETKCMVRKQFQHQKDPFCQDFFDNAAMKEKDADYITGDFTPHTIWHSEMAIPRIHYAYPDARLIVSLRDPLDRAYSHFLMMRRNHANGGNNFTGTFQFHCFKELERMRKVGLLPHLIFPRGANNTGSGSVEDMQKMYQNAVVNSTEFETSFHSLKLMEAWKTFKESWHKEFDDDWASLPGIVSRGCYAVMLQRWFKDFPREQFLVLSLDETSRDPQAVMKRLHKHVGVDHVPLKNVAPSFTRPESQKGEDMSDIMRQILSKVFQPYDEMLSTVLQDVKWKDPWAVPRNQSRTLWAGKKVHYM